MTKPPPSWGARLATFVILLLALWGAVAAIALQTGRLAPLDPSEAERDTGSAELDAAPAAAPAPLAGAPTLPITAPHASAEAQRLVICGREEAAPRLFELPAGLWGVACGTSLHIVAFEAERGVLIARRVAQVLLPSPAPDRAPRPAPVLALDAQREASWLIGTLRADRNGSPISGAIFRVPIAAGDLLGSALRLHDAAPQQLVAATLDKQPGQDFALLQLGDARVAQPSEVWLFSGGPAPLRSARKAVSIGATQLAAIDLDADGLDEVVALAPAQGLLTVLHASEAQAATALSVQGIEALHTLALGTALQLVLAGPQARVLRSRSDAQSHPAAPYEAVALPALDGMRDLVSLDVDADGKAEITGYAHPELVSVELDGVSDARAKRTPRFTLRGEGYAVHHARLSHLDGDGYVDALALVTSEGADPQVELLVLASRSVAPQAGTLAVRWPASAAALRNAPLLREIELR
jgi:hypothetical protein